VQAHADKHSLPENVAKEHMPSNFYLHHPENEGKYQRDFDEAQYNAIPQEDPRHQDITRPAQVQGGNDGNFYVKTPYGPVRMMSNPENATDVAYQDILHNITQLMNEGNDAEAQRLYESLPRIDRGIVMSDRDRLEAAHSTLNQLRENITSSGNNRAHPQSEMDEYLRQAQDYYRRLPFRFRQQNLNGTTTRTVLRNLERAHFQAYQYRNRPDAQAGPSWFSRIGNMIAPPSLSGNYEEFVPT
jgi:hypothetical protein